MPGPLDGLRVVDCSQGMAGTRATGILADYGAEVIWVEPPGGDPYRGELALAYVNSTRGKRSVVLDLQTEHGRVQLDRLLADADVLVQSDDPGSAAESSFDALHSRHPQLVCCTISGFGRDAHATVTGHESIVQAVVGAMGEQVGYRPGPIFGGVPFASFGAAYLSVFGVLAALYRRGIDGIGRDVETSLYDGALAYLAMMWGDSDDADRTPPIAPGASRLVARTFACSDGEYLGVHTGAVGAFGRLMKVLGLDNEVLASTTGVDMGDPLTPAEAEIIGNRVPEIFASKPRDYWVDRLLEADICGIPALLPGEVFDEPQVRNNNMVVELDDPVIGPHEQVARPLKFPGLDQDALRPAPALGEADDTVHFTHPTRWAIGTPTGSDTSEALLSGVRILDFGAFFAGPYSSKMLADLGADVIKVETPVGDQLRGLARPFQAAQGGKRAVALNLKDAELQPALNHLLEWADVVHHNMRPGAAERVGVGSEAVQAANPNIVYMQTPGWGTSGPNSRRQSFEPLMSGYAGVSYESGGRLNPPTLPLCNGDPGNGMLGATAILMGLLHRQRTGAALYLENPQLDATMMHLSHIVRRTSGEVLGAGRLDPLQMGISPANSVYETADGWICVAAHGPEDIAALTTAVGSAPLDSAKLDAVSFDESYADDLRDQLADRIRTRSTAAWLAEFDRVGVAAVSPLLTNNATAFLRQAENKASGRVAEVDGGAHGKVRCIGRLVRVSHCAMPDARRAPHLGEHTYELLEAAGYTADKISELAERGSIRTAKAAVPVA
jgi:crotonobetainyl-CoA:carnitine CoA-transferase CaiB-like acyl-CoA transferase